LYIDDEVRVLLKAALGLSPNDALRKWTYHGLLGLLAVSGLRLSEKRLHKPPSRLTLEDIDAPLVAAFLNDLEKSRSILTAQP
jgi:hypothetical protein